MRKLSFDSATRARIGSQPAIIARSTAHEAEVIVPNLEDGEAAIVIESGGQLERAGAIRIETEKNRKLVLAVRGNAIRLLSDDLYEFAPPTMH